MAGTAVQNPEHAHFLTIPEAAAYIRVCQMTMYNLANKKKGGPPVIRINRRILFPRDQFLQWISTAGTKRKI